VQDEKVIQELKGRPQREDRERENERGEREKE
jgi:hypothetical protein